MDAATKTGIDVAKNTSKRIVQKTAEATGREKMYEGREKIIEGFKNEIFPLYYDKEDEEQMEFEKEEEEEEKYLMRINLMKGLINKNKHN